MEIMTKKGPVFGPQNVRKSRRAKMGLPSRLSSVRASLLLAGAGVFFDGVACQGFERLGRVEPKSSDENHGVMYFDITTAYGLLRRRSIQVRGEGDKGRDQYKPDPDSEKITRTPQCLTCCGARGGKTIQGHPLVASIPLLCYWNLLSSMSPV